MLILSLGYYHVTTHDRLSSGLNICYAVQYKPHSSLVNYFDVCSTNFVMSGPDENHRKGSFIPIFLINYNSEWSIPFS